MNRFLTGFRSFLSGARFASDAVTYTAPDGSGNVDAQYDYAAIGKAVSAEAMAGRADRSIWHYAELLPVDRPRVDPHTPLGSLGWSPLYRAAVAEREFGCRAVWMKNDTVLPSASFKDRASAVVVAHAMARGIQTVVAASTGNAAAALAALCAGNGIAAVIFVPAGTPEGKLAQVLAYGARVFSVQGSYTDCVHLAAEAAECFGWYNRNTGTNPFTREGKKTAGYEIAEQLGLVHDDAPFHAPDVVIVPVGDGNIISGVWKGFYDLAQLGWINKIPRFIGATATLAPSLYRAWRSGGNTINEIASTTIASGISVDVPEDGHAALHAVRSTGGCLIECDDDEMLEAETWLARNTGVFVEPACAAGVVALRKARAEGLVDTGEEVVIQLTGHGLKDPRSALRAAGAPLDVRKLDDVVHQLDRKP